RELRPRALGHQPRAADLRQLEPPTEQLTRLGTLVPAPERGAEVGERLRELEPCGRILEDRHGLAKRLEAGLSALDQAVGSQRDPERARTRARASRKNVRWPVCGSCSGSPARSIRAAASST